MIDFFLMPENTPFLIALCVVLLLAFIEVASMVVGVSASSAMDQVLGIEIDADADVPDGVSGGPLSWLGVGRVPLLVILVGILLIGMVMVRLYKKSTKETAYVRTGLGGAKVILDGGALVLPVLHDVMPVSLRTHKLTVQRVREEALITNDNFRVDVTVEFYVRVARNDQSIQNAAATLGDQTNDPNALQQLVEGKFVDALRTAAAEMPLKDLHLRRAEFVQRVQNVASEDLAKNGLELESASLTGLDQTDEKYFNPNNAFDAEGLARLKVITESKRQERNAVEQETEVAIQTKNLEATKQKLALEREAEEAALTQAKDIAVRRAEQESQVAAEQAARRREAETARIIAEREIEEAEIERRKSVELASQQRDIAVAAASREKSAADAQAAEARAEAVRAEERIETTRAVEQANRAKAVKLVEAEQEAEQEAISIRVQANAEKQAAEERAEAARIAAHGDADAEKARAEARGLTLKVEAEGERALNEARNLLNPEVISMQVKQKLIEVLPAIIEQSVKPMQQIDSIRIVQVDGLNGVAGGAAGQAANANHVGGSLPDQVVNAALRHRASAPLLDNLMQEVGLDGVNASDLGKLVKGIVGGEGVASPEAPAIEASAEPARVAPEAGQPAQPRKRASAKVNDDEKTVVAG